MAQITAVCISRQPERLLLDERELPFVNLAGDLPGYNIAETAKRYGVAWQNRDWRSSLDYIRYLADKRNLAVKLALEQYPDTRDLLMIDSYYLQQTKAITNLISDYEILRPVGPLILGGAVWGKQRTRISHLFGLGFQTGKNWYDKWGVPELRWAPYKWWPPDDWLAFRFRVPMEGLYRTMHTSGIFIFPRTAWDNGARFSVYPDIRSVELAPFLEETKLPIYIDFNAAFERRLVYSVLKCIRCSLGGLLH